MSELSREQAAIVDALASEFGATEVLPYGSMAVLARGIASAPVYCDPSMVVAGPTHDGPWWFVSSKPWLLPCQLRWARPEEIDSATQDCQARALLSAAGLPRAAGMADG